MPSFSRWRWSGRRLLAKEVSWELLPESTWASSTHAAGSWGHFAGGFLYPLHFQNSKSFPLVPSLGSWWNLTPMQLSVTPVLQLGGQVFIWRTFHQPLVSPLPLQNELQNLNLHQACWKFKSTIHQVRPVFFWSHSNSFSQDIVSLSTI